MHSSDTVFIIIFCAGPPGIPFSKTQNSPPATQRTLQATNVIAIQADIRIYGITELSQAAWVCE